MTFSTPSKVCETIRSLDWVERERDQNRVPVAREFNGFPPLSDDEASEVGLDVNVNFKVASMMGAEAITQYKSAFTGQGQYFTVSLMDAPLDKREQWSQFITTELKTMMTHPRSQSSRAYLNLWDDKAASIILWGPGLQQWCGPDAWCPNFVAIEDFRVPTETNVSLDNLPWFAIRRRYTPGEIYQKAFREGASPRWKKGPLQKILKAIKDDGFRRQFTNDDWQTPTRWLEKIKQDAGFYCSDAVLEIPMWDFYFQSEDGEKWLRRCVADVNTPGQVQSEWLYSSGDKAEGNRISELLHLLPGDLNNKPPLKFHSMRSLGFTLVDPAFWQNITTCWLVHHTMQSFRPWFRITDPLDKAKAQFVDIGSSVNIQEGVQIVPWEQRHRIDSRLVEMTMARMQQVMGQASDTYTQELDTGTQKERTAFETNALMSLKNSGLQRIFMDAYRTENFAYVEICRRACRANTTDKDCQKFQKRCEDYGIPRKYLDVDRWDVQPVTTMGMGNDVLEFQKAQMLMSIKPQLPPEGQDRVMYKYVMAVTKNPSEAAEITQMGKKPQVTDSVHDAQLAFGALMQGVAVQPKSGFNAIEQVETLIPMMAQFIERASAIGAMEPEDTLGLNSVALYVQAQMQRIEADPREKQRVKMYGDALGKIMNQVKALDQQTQEAKGNPNMDAEMMQKLQLNQAKFEQGMQQKEQKLQFQTQTKSATWEADQMRKQQSHQLEQQRTAETHLQEQAQTQQTHALDLRQQAEKQAMDLVKQSLSLAQQARKPKPTTAKE